MKASSQFYRIQHTLPAILLGALLILPVFLTPSYASQVESLLFMDGNKQDVFSYEDGLLSTSTNAIAQTRDGFIWIGGYGGLVRYDDRKFDLYNLDGLTNIQDLLPASECGLWIASTDTGLIYYNYGEFTFYNDTYPQLSREVLCLAPASDDKVYFGTTNGLAWADTQGNAGKLDIPQLNSQYIKRVATLSGDALAAITRNGELYECSGEELQDVKLIEDYQNVRSVRWDCEDKIYYIGTTANQIYCCSESWELLDVINTGELNCVNDIAPQPGDQIVVSTDNGIGVYEDGTFRIQRMLISNSIDRILEDAERNFWFTSSRQGILRISRGRFRNLSQSAGLDNVVVNAVVKIGERLYIGHDDGLIILDVDSYKVITDARFECMQNTRIRDMYMDELGGIWFATKSKGLLCFNENEEWVTYNSDTYPAIPSDNFRCIYRVNNTLIAGTDTGACTIDLTDRNAPVVENLVKDPSQLTERVLNVGVIDNTVYLGTDGYGICIVENGEVVKWITTESGLSSNVVMKFFKAETFDGFWMVTGNSISYMEPDGSCKRMEHLPASNKLDLVIINGRVLILTNTGIFVTTESSLMAGGEITRNYSHSDGLPFEITANSHQFIDGDMLYFCGSRGAASLRTSTDSTDTAPYQLVVDSISEDGKLRNIQGVETCILDSHTQRIDLHAHVLTYRPVQPVLFYYMEGFENEMRTTSLRSLSTISYTNMDGGNYIFHFGVIDSDTREILQEITVPIVKQYKWFETVLFRLAVILAALGLISLFIIVISRMKTRRLERILSQEYDEKEKRRLEEIAYKDYLTGLYNRNYIEVWNERILPEAQYPVTFIFMDCNDLKKINDAYGHKEGDMLLISMAALMKSCFDDPRCTLFRLGGDEFLVLCCGMDEGTVSCCMRRMRVDASNCIIEGNPLSFSYGLVSMSSSDFDFDEGLRIADEEMMEHKKLHHGGRRSTD